MLTPIDGAMPAFTHDTTQPDALSDAGSYRVVLLSFPFEADGSASHKVDLVNRVFAFFGP